MVSFPFCKINLGLQIHSRRQDGYHEIETCYYPIPWSDVLEILPASKFEFVQTGLTLPGNQTDNLVFKAYSLLKKDYNLPEVRIHLHKIIPFGAGLGGGSSDGAFAIRTLNSICQLNIDDTELERLALMLGSDCPFFIQHKPLIGKGRGEILEASLIDLTGHYIVLLVPDIHISTAEAYAGVKARLPGNTIRDIIAKPIVHWKNVLHNDFEISIFDQHPYLKEMKEHLYSLGALYASMSGSGSSIYGIFQKEINWQNDFKGLRGWSGWM